MNKADLVTKLEELRTERDKEGSHYDADFLLLDYINDQDVTDAYEALERWYA